MIPKLIHYVWIGPEMPALQKACLRSWKEQCQDFEIKHWSISEMPDDPLVHELIRKRQYAFVSDYVRLHALINYGGIYLDSDIELIRPLTSTLDFAAFLGEESPGRITNGVCGSVPGHPFFKECLSFMRRKFVQEKLIVYSPEVTTQVLLSRAWPDIQIFSREVFYPYNPYHDEIKNLLYSSIKEQTIGIHHWAKSWSLTPYQRLRRLMAAVRKKVVQP